MRENGNGLKILACDSGRLFALSMIEHLNLLRGKKDKSDFCQSQEITFANGEIKTVIDESIRGSDVYVVQLLDDPLKSNRSINDNLIALAGAINAAYQSDAHRVTAVIPQFPYSRQDKKKGREPITAKIAGRLLEISGAKHAITLDIHSEAIEGFFERLKLQNLHMGRILIEYVKKNIATKHLMVVAPDVNSAKRGLFFSKNLSLELAIIDKVRDYSKTSTISNMRLVGSVEGKDVLICDDMLATGGTVLSACQLLKDQGAKDIFIAVAFPFFSGNAVENFDKAYEKGWFNKIIGTNAVFWDGNLAKELKWYEELDVTNLFAQVVYNLHLGESVSTLLI